MPHLRLGDGIDLLVVKAHPLAAGRAHQGHVVACRREGRSAGRWSSGGRGKAELLGQDGADSWGRDLRGGGQVAG